MVLDGLDRKLAVTHSHDFAVVAAGGNLEAIGQGGGVNSEGVVAHCLEVLRNALEDAFAVV